MYDSQEWERGFSSLSICGLLYIIFVNLIAFLRHSFLSPLTFPIEWFIMHVYTQLSTPVFNTSLVHNKHSNASRWIMFHPSSLSCDLQYTTLGHSFCVGIYVLATIVMKTRVFWIMKPCSLVNSLSIFRRNLLSPSSGYTSLAVILNFTFNPHLFQFILFSSFPTISYSSFLILSLFNSGA
jgi:hypothetical protein